MGPWAWARLVSSVIHPCPSPLGLFLPWFTVNPSLQLPSLFTGSLSQEFFFLSYLSLWMSVSPVSLSHLVLWLSVFSNLCLHVSLVLFHWFSAFQAPYNSREEEHCSAPGETGGGNGVVEDREI